MKRISNIVIILVLTFAFTFALPQKEADAFVWGAAVPAGITIGAGTYTVAALGLGALVGIAGYDTYSEEINAHAYRAWGNGSQLAIDSMNAMINASVGLGHSMTALDSGFNTWFETQIDGLASTVTNADSKIFYENISYSAISEYGVNMSKPYPYNHISITFSPNNQVLYNGSSQFTGFAITITDTNISATANGAFVLMKESSPAILQSFITAYDALNQQSVTAAIGFIASIGLTGFALANTDNPAIYNNSVSKIRESWEEMKDAGLVLPVDSAIPVYQGNIATYNPTSDVYTGVDGGVINPADLTWSFPQPRIRTGEELDVTVPPGVYVDNPAGVYTPSLPTTAVPDIAIPTTTSITTGVTTTIPKTGTGEPPPTGGTTPKGEPVNPFKVKPMPIAALTGLFQLLAALIFYLIRMFTFIATLALIAPTPIDNPYFIWFTTATFQGITPYPLVQNLALFFLGFSVYRSVRRVFG